MQHISPRGLGNGNHTISEEDAIKRLAAERAAEPDYFIIRRGKNKKGKRGWKPKVKVSKWEFVAHKGQFTKFELISSTTLREK